MAIHLYIGGVEHQFRSGTLSISDELNTRNRCKFELVDRTGEYFPEVGSVVRVTETYMIGEEEQTEEKFEGTLDEPEFSTLERGGDENFIVCDAVSYDQLCDRYHVAAVYANQTCKQIIADAFTNSSHSDIYLESIDVGEFVQDGPTIEKHVCNYITATDLLNDLAKMSGYKWFVDKDKKLHFFERQTTPAPFELTDTSGNFRKFKLRRTRQDYRNVQIVRGGMTTTDSRTDRFVGDSKRRTFTLKYQVNSMEGIRLRRNGGAWEDQIVAVQGTEGAEWTYLKGSPDISQADSGTVLAGVDEIEVTYVGEFPVIAKAPREDEIEARKAVEGGGGIYEHIEFDDSIEKSEAAEQKATSLLDGYAKIPRVITFETDTRGLQAGQAIQITLSHFGLDDVFLITRVDTKDLAGKHLTYTVRCIGSEYDSWVQYFRDAFKRPKRLVARENETLLLLRSLRDRVRTTATVTAAPSRRPSCVSDDTDVGFAEVENFVYYFLSGGQIIIGRAA